MDRIDIHVEVPRIDHAELSDRRPGEPSSAIRERLAAARARQTARFTGTTVKANQRRHGFPDNRPVRRVLSRRPAPARRNRPPVAPLGPRLAVE
jgi:hypothetical protein